MHCAWMVRTDIRYVRDDGGCNVELYNQQIDELRSEGIKTWYNLPWLFAECLLCEFVDRLSLDELLCVWCLLAFELRLVADQALVLRLSLFLLRPNIANVLCNPVSLEDL